MLHEPRQPQPDHPRETLRILSLTAADKKPPQEDPQRREAFLPPDPDPDRKTADRHWM
ncbi:MAG TPA: hypothetical protein VN699_06730 [Pirellulales bacterium]|nr:hypothetical protein [Pirellulales bacterium]